IANDVPELKTKAVQEIKCRLVFIAWDKFHQHALEAVFLGNLPQPGKHIVLNFSSKYAAAQEQGVGDQRILGNRVKSHPDQPIISKAVTHIDHQAFAALKKATQL